MAKNPNRLVLMYSEESSVSFDIANEVFREMSLPDSAHASLRYRCLGFVEGCLSTVSHILCQNCEVWVMKEYGVVQSWTKQYIITEKMVNRPLGLLDSGELLLRKWNGSLILFNPKKRKVEDFGISMGLFTFQVVTYMESLVSVMPDEQSNSMEGKHQVIEARNRKDQNSSILNYLFSLSFLAPFYDHFLVREFIDVPVLSSCIEINFFISSSSLF
ncbi:hypothetical protein L1049_011976 [Liquidambar formosana]|uniref:F-box associated domain-containing protein n=1 Tax=Liquidambar formosana TaxID=63359 RepID=A0AAP0RXF5_LIQFO